MLDRRPGDQDDHGKNDDRENTTHAQIDLTLLFMTDLHVGSDRLYKQKRKNTSLNLSYGIDGDMHHRSYLSPLSWRAIILFALT